jgi:hypothetical protein
MFGKHRQRVEGESPVLEGHMMPEERELCLLQSLVVSGTEFCGVAGVRLVSSEPPN